MRTASLPRGRRSCRGHAERARALRAHPEGNARAAGQHLPQRMVCGSAWAAREPSVGSALLSICRSCSAPRQSHMLGAVSTTAQHYRVSSQELVLSSIHTGLPRRASALYRKNNIVLRARCSKHLLMRLGRASGPGHGAIKQGTTTVLQ